MTCLTSTFLLLVTICEALRKVLPRPCNPFYFTLGTVCASCLLAQAFPAKLKSNLQDCKLTRNHRCMFAPTNKSKLVMPRCRLVRIQITQLLAICILCFIPILIVFILLLCTADFWGPRSGVGWLELDLHIGFQEGQQHFHGDIALQRDPDRITGLSSRVKQQRWEPLQTEGNPGLL